jgi:hypothetical protein
MKWVMTWTRAEWLTAINPKTMFAAWMIVIAVWASTQPAVAARPSTTPSPFAGTYCGSLDNRNYGSMSISDSGNISGYFSYRLLYYFESYTLSGRVSAAGAMRLKVVRTIVVNDRGRRTFTERYSITVNVTLDESGNLVATSGASFVLSPCP